MRIPQVRPSEEGRGSLSFFRIHGRDLTSASDGVGTIPPHSLAFRPDGSPRPPPRSASRRSPGPPEEGFGSAGEGNGADLAELDSTR